MVMKSLKSLQELINEKAEYRLNTDIGNAAEAIRNNPLLRTTDNPGLPDIHFKSKTGEDRMEKPFWFFQPNSLFWDQVKAYWLPIYIAEETENFLKKVDDLDSEIQGLKNAQYIDEY
jgi:hypothetical protein